ncbi:integral membrane protein [Tremella mesenterica]|uniref:Integral membrane protein n=1 Tax=Tremella mesenterica TaxID=5217 RepID=A0A4Q1BQ71_TREME|nr:uncharacterized protein TREMEDRAFT_33227 [Tremella mesenterica DSM 1558]EIW67703.1 hypothetical protein TREMEDRAFT_33227 [Tremella mesenterica DSM 1558]RXK40069.1 integral membrane protein [Tremella mesenterica]
MSSKMGVSTLVVGMFLTGCANSLLTKYQDKQCVDNCGPDAPGPPIDFEQPVWQTVNMFVGEALCVIPLLWTFYARKRRISGQVTQDDDSSIDDDTAESFFIDSDRSLTGWRVCWMWFPAFFDICGTTLMNVGLIFTPVSIYQMSRGALVLWVGILSVIFLRRHLWLYQWTSLVIVTLGVCLVGLSGSLTKKPLDNEHQSLISAMSEIAKRSDDDPAKVALGVVLILFAQNFTACQYVVEEKILSRYKVDPLAAVSLEGFFGLVTTLSAMPFLHFFFHARSPFFDVPLGWHQIISTPSVMWTSVAIAISIGAFNFFGLSVTHSVSATTRSTIDTCRTLGIWIVSLGVGWEVLVWPFSLLQVMGFGMLVYGTFVFNGLLRPVLFPPPPQVHLPHEPELGETGELPAAGGQTRAGYDILAEREE